MSERTTPGTREVPVATEALRQAAGRGAIDGGGSPIDVAGWATEAVAGVPTEWAGLPFLLATAEAAGLPDRLIDDLDLAARPMPWCVHEVGRAITGVQITDPGLLALAGLSAARAGELEAAPRAEPAEQHAIALVARDWCRVTAARLAAAASGPEAAGFSVPGAAEEVVLRVVRRPGRVVAEPGWIEIHLPLDGVDLAVRRAGLDVDPGWVGWLGTVVRYIYG